MGRVAVFTGHGHPMEIVELPSREPRGREVLVRVVCCTLCRSDLHTHAGKRVEATPTVLGHEIVGRIEAFGPEAARVDGDGAALSIGARVSWGVAAGCGSCFYCGEDLPQKCERLYKYGHERMTAERPFCGGLADYVMLAPGTAIFRVPDGVSDRVAATANCATATVAALLRNSGGVAGRHVLVLGAGMLGVTACAMARAEGAASVLASDPLAANRERARTFGATAAFSAEAAELAEHVHGSTGGRGADIVLELAGTAESVATSLARTRIGGTVVLAGTVAPTAGVTFEPEKVVRRMLTIRGVHNYHPSDLGAALRFLAGAGRAYPFESLIATKFPLAQVEQAFAHAHSHPGTRVAVVPQ